MLPSDVVYLPDYGYLPVPSGWMPSSAAQCVDSQTQPSAPAPPRTDQTTDHPHCTKTQGEMRMTASTNDFDRKAFSARPGYDEPRVRREFAQLVPLRTVVIHCFDPRVVGIPAAVARDLGDE